MTHHSARGAELAIPLRAPSLPRGLLVPLVALATLAMCASRAHAQAAASATVRLSLEDALRMAQAQSQTVEVARAGVTRAGGQRYQARSLYLPQLNGTLGYTKTLASQFSSFKTAAAPADTTGGGSSSGGAGGFDLSKTSFGATNQWALGINFSQAVYAGGRIAAQNRAAAAQLRSADIEVAAQRAQVSLDVTSAYFDAVLADQLVAIADSSVAQTQALLDQTKVARQVGNASEYELLRAQVTHDNEVPIAIQARSNRDEAYLHLKQLLNVPLDGALELTTHVEAPEGPTLPAIAGTAIDTVVADRAPLRELDQAVIAQESQVKIARAERIPSFSIVSGYQRLYFPQRVFPSISSGVNNWTVGVSTNFPIFDGGRIKGDELVAQAGLQQVRAQREETRQLAALDTRVALNALEQARATWDASRGTADQAQRAYAIDQVRFREGISTQTDLAQSRLLLEQALANRAQAARNYAVARVHLSLLRDLPLQAGAGAAAASSSGGAAGAIQSQQQQQQSQSQQQSQQSQSTQQRGASTTQSAPGAGAGAPSGSSQS